MKSLVIPFLTAIGVSAATSHMYSNLRVIVKDNSPPSPSVASSEGEIYAEGDLEADGNLNIAGTSTLGGTLGVTGLITASGGLTGSTPNTVTGADSLVAADCGKETTVTAGIDGSTIVLPEASTVLGCTFTISYIGADGGALVDISPLDSDADGIEGGCTLAASVVNFSGTADADIGLTKATSQTGDFIKLNACSATQYCVVGCQGIWANN